MGNKGAILSTTRAKIAAIEEEYGEPFVQVLQGFADMGYSRNMVAPILDWDRPSFFRFLERHPEIEVRWPAMKDLVSWQRLREPGRRTRPPTPVAGRHLIHDEWLGLHEAARKHKINPNTVVTRYRSGKRGNDLVAPVLPKEVRQRKASQAAAAAWRRRKQALNGEGLTLGFGYKVEDIRSEEA